MWRMQAEDIGKDDVIIIGREGLLLAGPNAGKLEGLAMLYTGLMSALSSFSSSFVGCGEVLRVGGTEGRRVGGTE
eukprot:3863153-Rhodomonas_salina.1